MSEEPMDTPCERCHERPGHGVADAWLCDLCEKIMDPDVMAFYSAQNKADQASLTARLGAAERETRRLTAEIETWKSRYFSAGRSDDAFAADMARLMVQVIKGDEAARRERDQLMALVTRGGQFDRARIISLLFDVHDYSTRRGLWFPTDRNRWIEALDNPKRMCARWIRNAEGKVEMVSFAGSEDALYTTEV